MYVISGKRLLACVIVLCCVMMACQGICRPLWEDWVSASAISIHLGQTEPPIEEFSVEVIAVSPQKRQHRVFIYHTHTYEAYDMRDGNQYRPTETWRTADQQYNVVRIGAELASQLEKAGVYVTHDTTAYEMPRLSSAYSRSLEGLEKAAEKGYDLYIDLHRDSYSKNNGPNTIQSDGMQMGRYLFLIGQGTGTGLDEKPDWESNQRVALIISNALNNKEEGLSRGVSLKSGRYNQHVATPSILIEAGNNQNTLTEMLSAVPPLAAAICAYLDGLE